MGSSECAKRVWITAESNGWKMTYLLYKENALESEGSAQAELG